MEDKATIAAQKFLGGYNCAQSVFFAFCADVGVEPDLALRLACGFGAGMGRQQEVCGALSGAILALGAKYGRGAQDGPEARELTYQKVRELFAAFSAERGACTCRQILGGIDLLTEAGQAQFKAEDQLTRSCVPSVQSAARILETLL
jgi:C_GCAxxG_C_C family probable redox protein